MCLKQQTLSIKAEVQWGDLSKINHATLQNESLINHVSITISTGFVSWCSFHFPTQFKICNINGLSSRCHHTDCIKCLETSIVTSYWFRASETFVFSITRGNRSRVVVLPVKDVLFNLNKLLIYLRTVLSSCCCWLLILCCCWTMVDRISLLSVRSSSVYSSSVNHLFRTFLLHY